MTDTRPPTTHWCSVVTPYGVTEYCLPRFVRDVKPEHHAAYRTLYDLSRQYKTKVEFSDHPVKYDLRPRSMTNADRS